jgi:peptide deformylase
VAFYPVLHLQNELEEHWWKRFRLDATKSSAFGRVVIAQTCKLPVPQPLVLFNPEIVRKEGKTTYDEGCLSVPTYYETVERFNLIEVKALGIDGKPIHFTTDGLLAICIQHEIDHLDGKLFIDRLSPIKSMRIKSKIKKFGYPDPSHPQDEEELEELLEDREEHRL